LKKGIEIKGANIWAKGKKKGHVQFNDLRKDISPYQFMLGFPQDQQEEMLEKQLADFGMKVERSTELISFTQSENGIRAQLRLPSGEKEFCEAKYLAGCDGARSLVREQLGVGFPGGTYEETFYVADIKATGLFVPGEVNIALDTADFLAIFPLKGINAARLVGTIKEEATNKEQLQWKDVSEGVIKRLKLEIEELNWFSTYRVHHRVASHFRDRNVFLLGDAAHIHSPVGGQGMNTGIGDAVNLAWKMGKVIKGNAPIAILDTFEQERIPFANQLVATTDRAFEFVNAKGRFAKFIRLNIVPYLVPWLFSFVAARRFLFRTISQLGIHYRHSDLNVSSKDKITGGDRLPWLKFESDKTDNFASLTSLDWQVHIYGTPSLPIQEFCKNKSIKLNVFPWNRGSEKAGLKKNSIYMIRPDGHIGTIGGEDNIEKIDAYCKKWRI